MKDITIGSPIANTQVYILDKDNNPVPIGIPGELCIAGEGVGKGYLNRPELTAERFVPNPFATEENRHGKTMYRTGDLALFRSNGEIEYLGRIDTQVKIRGLRIELGEIESVMASFPGIALCTVADKRDETGRQYLVGYYTMDGKNTAKAEKATQLDERALRAHLSAKLPKYMVPNYFLRLDTMPMTASSKTDRKNLPMPEFTRLAKEYAPPETDAEKRLAGIWCRLLSVERAGRTDNFFELGGDSLLAISMLSEIEKEFHVEVSVKEMMEQAELAALARRLEETCKTAGHSGTEDKEPLAAPSRIAVRHADRYPLLPQQKAVYAFCMKEPDTLAYNMPAKINLPDTVDRDRLKAAIVQVLDCHRILKSRILMEKAGLYGYYDENAKLTFEVYEAGQEDNFVRPFDLGKAPLVRVGFTKEALLFDMHHIIGDGASMNILLRDIASAYEGGALRKPELEYSDYAAYFYGQDMGEHRAYFKESLKCDMEPVALPQTKHPGKGGESRLYQLPEEVFAGARRYARENGLTDTMVFLGAYGILLSRFTGRKEILSSIILQNRAHGDVKEMVGMFVNTLPVCFALEQGNALEQGKAMEDSALSYMQKIKEKLLGMFRYQELPFEDISEAVAMDRLAVNTSFVYQGDGEKTLSLGGLELVPRFLKTHTSKFDLSMELTPAGKACGLRLEYNLAKYDGQLMDDLAEGYIRILGQLDRERLADISVLSEEEYRKIIEGFNDTYVDYPRDKCVHELFMEQATRTPERVALVFEERKFTYRQLDEMSDSFACFLKVKGVKHRDRVAVLLKRDERAIIAQLAVLKLGAVFIPIDSRYPQDRVEYVIAESDARILLKNRDNGMRFPVECCVEEWDSASVESFDSVQVSPEEPCYAIFTSGSTGSPKGCLLTNRGIVNFCRNNNILETCNMLKEQICISVNTISFDFFIAESLLPLVNGYTVVLANEEESMNQELFSKTVKRNRVNIVQTTPTRYKLYFADYADLSYARQLQVIVTSGEALSLDLFKCLAGYTNAVMFNPLGPSECSVWATGGRLYFDRQAVSENDITIGTPIANTQIYILDGDLRPVPIGVPGELCIAGEGVGKGYLNRPELTAERFVPNPFATEENRHGKTMYRTGDLARFRRDGEIEYLGAWTLK